MKAITSIIVACAIGALNACGPADMSPIGTWHAVVSYTNDSTAAGCAIHVGTQRTLNVILVGDVAAPSYYRVTEEGGPYTIEYAVATLPHPVCSPDACSFGAVFSVAEAAQTAEGTDATLTTVLTYTAQVDADLVVATSGSKAIEAVEDATGFQVLYCTGTFEGSGVLIQ